MVILAKAECDPHHEFACVSGGCVHFEMTCNGAVNCADGSDEDESYCGKNQSDYCLYIVLANNNEGNLSIQVAHIVNYEPSNQCIHVALPIECILNKENNNIIISREYPLPFVHKSLSRSTCKFYVNCIQISLD